MGKQVDLTGQSFGRLTAIEIVGKNNQNRFVWNCLCECGQYTKVSSNCLKTGNTKSCGCLNKEAVLRTITKHGYASGGKKSSEYYIWQAMIKRCTNEKYREYAYYGGRGIAICHRWLKSFENFIEDMGKRPSLEHSLDRIDVNGNYEPDNCRWTTAVEQSRNRRVRTNSASGVSGVNWNKRDNMWYAIISVNRKQIHLGCFKDLNDAIEARKAAEEKYWNEQPS